MPRYEYHCATCGKNFEVTQRMSDPSITDCDCGAKGSVSRLMSAGSGLIFKGSGFYITDYKGGSGSGGGEGKSEGSSSSSTAVEAKPSNSGGSTGGGCGSGCACC